MFKKQIFNKKNIDEVEVSKLLTERIKPLKLIAIILIPIVIGSYTLQFGHLGFSDDQEIWAQYGDFIGGILNPILAFLAFAALLFTIELQLKSLITSKEELNLTRKELEKSRIAQEKQSESLILQNNATRLQSFENTFFKLFDLFNLTKNTLNVKIDVNNKSSFQRDWNIRINSIDYNYDTHWIKYQGSNNGKKAIEVSLAIFKNIYFKNYEEFNLSYESVTGAYFGQIYQILKFVDNSNIKDKQRYINIFRAQLTKYELELLFYHCLGSIGKTRFKPLVEKYEFFEHIIYTNDIDKLLKNYDIRAFGKNKMLLDKYNRVNGN